ncbi:MAG: uracil-DNA glycosylase [Verrucomicrobia bacterium]|nr:uracil-DNA glycosylase [Verrucomicrobiota bacterium]
MTIEKSWYEKLKDEINKPYIADLKKFLAEEKSPVYPPEDLVFNAFAHTPYDKVKVVIVGQDPYHGAGQAHGLSFSVPKGVKPPPSLKNIFLELNKDLQVPIPNHGCLEGWARQGVLLLNATLTVRAGEPKSHHDKGWERFTDAVIDVLAQRKEPMVFMLWGKSAQEKGHRLLGTHHAVLQAAHPSPYSVDGFFGCRHFSKANDFLKQWGQTGIDWGLI